MAKKVAKLVMISLMTRVVVDKNATDEEIAKAAKPHYLAIINNNEILDNLEEIVDDEECPFGEIHTDRYFQPDITNMQYLTGVRKKKFQPLFSFQVFKDKKLAQKAFPGVEIKEYAGDDIGEPTFIDECFSKRTGKRIHHTIS